MMDGRHAPFVTQVPVPFFFPPAAVLVPTAVEPPFFFVAAAAAAELAAAPPFFFPIPQRRCDWRK